MKLAEDVLTRCNDESTVDVAVTALTLLTLVARAATEEGKALLVVKCLEAILGDLIQPLDPSSVPPPPDSMHFH